MNSLLGLTKGRDLIRFSELGIGDRFVIGYYTGPLHATAKKIKTSEDSYDLYFLDGSGPYHVKMTRKKSPLVTKILE